MRKIWMLTASMACLAAVMPAWAQSDQPEGGLETVIVTARKVPENAQTVPISITALTADDLEKLNINTVTDLQSVAPSFVIQPSTFRQDTLDITVRGQRNFDSPSGGGNTALDFDPSVAIYQDGVYYARTVGLTGQMFDLESVDILKGPQGTLVGRNSTGGAVLMTSREPTQDGFGGYVKLTGGDYAQYGLQGAVNIPITDTLAVRAAISLTGQKGYIANYFYDPVSGMRNSQPAMGTQKIAGRVSAKWQPDDSFSLLVRADISAEHDTGSSYHDLGYFVGTVAATGPKTSICNIAAACAGFTDLLGHPVGAYYLTSTATSVSNVNTSPAAYNSLLNSVAREQTDGFWSTEQSLSNLDVGHYHTVSAVADKKFDDDIDVKLTGAYRWFDSTGTSISRGQPYVSAQYVFNIPDYQSYQTELTATGMALDSKLKWTGGLFFFEESDPRDGGFQWLFLPSAGPNGPSPNPGKQASTTDQTRNGELNISYAAYAQVTYAIWPDTRLTLGGRYTIDQRNAHLDTQKIVWPFTPGVSTAVTNGVYNSGTYTADGIGYAGFTTVCSLTDATGASLPLTSCPTDLSRTFHQPTWTLAIDHDLSDKTMVYFTMRSGYRSGAINSGTFNPSVIVAQPEKVIDYEAGIKSDWDIFGTPVRTNFDGYTTTYHNLQAQQNLPNVTLATGPGGVGPCTQALFNANQCVTPTNVLNNVTFNVAAAKVSGLEWDTTALLTPDLTVNFAGSYLDARYTNYTFTPPAGYLLPAGNTGNLSGTPIPAPRWQMNVTGTYSFGALQWGDFSANDLSITAHYYWQSKFLADLALVANGAAQQAPAWGLLNLQVRLANVGNLGADITAFMNNVVNSQICIPEFNGTLNSAPNGSFTSPGTSGVLQCIPMAPREMGLSLQYNF
jgi:iron complex outermembrane receptor protein